MISQACFSFSIIIDFINNAQHLRQMKENTAISEWNYLWELYAAVEGYCEKVWKYWMWEYRCRNLSNPSLQNLKDRVSRIERSSVLWDFFFDYKSFLMFSSIALYLRITLFSVLIILQTILRYRIHCQHALLSLIFLGFSHQASLCIQITIKF